MTSTGSHIYDETGAISSRFCPTPEPGSERLTTALDLLRRLEVDLVGIGNIGPLLPALRPSTISPQELAEDYWGKYAPKRVEWAQAWHPRAIEFPHPNDRSPEAQELAARNEDLRLRCEQFDAGLASVWHLARHPSVCMSISGMKHLSGLGDAEIATRFGIATQVLNHARGLEESRGIARNIPRGDALWGRVGAWPWAAFIDNTGEGTMPADWWKDERAELSLQTFILEHATAAEREADAKANAARVLRLESSR